MKSLSTEFTCNADKCGEQVFRQMRRSDGVAMYQRIRPDGGIKGYEVFIIKTIKAGTALPGGKSVAEDYEQYPGAAQWGKTAWSPGSESAAEEKFDDLVLRMRSEVGQPKRPGRKAVATTKFVVPSGKFTMKMLVAHTGMTQPVLYLKIQKLITDGKVVVVDRIRSENSRGRLAVVYQTKQ
jgi:hypothetical protein